MKTLLAVIAVLIATAAIRAQNGSVIFANRLAGVFDAPATVGSAAGPGFGTLPGALVQLYIVNGTSLTPVGAPIGFRGNTDPLAKYFDGGSVELPGTSVGGTVTLRVRTWVGASYAASASMFRGETPDFRVLNLGGGILPASHLENMRPFLIGLPEPTPLVLGGLGMGIILAAWSRWKR